MPTALKWVLGILGVAVVVVCFAAWYGYRALQNFAQTGPNAAVVIGAPASRVFASIAVADSMTEWRSEGLGIRSSRRGVLQVGDTSLVSRGDSTGVVTTFTAPVLDSLRRRGDGTGKATNAVMGFASNMMIAALRVMSQQELKQLKGHVEGPLPN